MKPNFDGIPNELKDINQWCLWKNELVEKDKPTKVPYQINGQKASSTDKLTWSSFEQAVKFQGVDYDGIGFFFSADDPYVFIDIDNVVADDGTIADWAYDIVKSLDSYAEISPSMHGLHIFIKGNMPENFIHKKNGIEIYNQKRYSTITGYKLSGFPLTIADRQKELDDLYKQYFTPENTRSRFSPNTSRQNISPDLTDNEVIELLNKAFNRNKFVKLFYNGDCSDYPRGDGTPDQSSGDLALANLIAFYTQKPEQIISIIKQSALYDKKWDREDYQNRIINIVLPPKEIFKQHSRTQNSPYPGSHLEMPSNVRGQDLPKKNGRRIENALEFLKREKTRTPYIIEKIIPESGFTSIAGYTGHGKSSLAMQMILSILSGTPFLNQFEIKSPDCHILYINLENSDFTLDSLIHSQLKDIPVKESVLAGNLFIPDAMAMSFDNRNDVIRIKKWIDELHIEIIVVDPILDSFTGDQNDLTVIRALIKKLREINGKLSWILLQHFNKGDNDQELIKLMLGSIGFANAMTSIIGLRRYAKNEDPKIKRVEFGKTRDYEKPDDIRVQMNHNRIFEVCGHGKERKVDSSNKVVEVLEEYGSMGYSELVGKIGLFHGYSEAWSKKMVHDALLENRIAKTTTGIHYVKKQIFNSYLDEFK